MNWYSGVKAIHVTCVVFSIAGFFARGVLMLAGSPRRHARWLRVAPHVNDAILLAAALTLAALSRQYPFVDGWLSAKVFGLIAYIMLGSVALGQGRGKRVRMTAWLAALLVFAYVVSVALSRDARGFLAWF
jgi:uncharacterized membrane protein SirB2